MTLLATEPGLIGEARVRLAQIMANLATVGILQQRTIERGHEVRNQLQTALHSRVVIEQAKGVLA